MKYQFKEIDDILIYALLFWFIGVAGIVKSIIDNLYEGAVFYGGLISFILTTFIILRYYIKNK